MVKPIIRLMLLWQTIPIALLMFAPLTEPKLRLGRRHGKLISASYFFLGCTTLIMLGVSADRQGNILLGNVQLVVLLAAYFSGWTCAVRAPNSHKFLMLAVMLHCAAMLNATSVSFLSIFLDADRLASIRTGGGILLLLCLLATVWILIWYFLRRVFQKRLLFLEDREARRGLTYLCVLFVLFCATAYDPLYQFQTRPPLGVISLAATNMAACMIFFRESVQAKSQTEAACDLAVRQIQYRQLRRTMKALSHLRRETRCSSHQYDAAYARLDNQERSGDPIVDSVLENFLFQAAAEEMPIQCKVSVDGRAGMDGMDLAALLNACLEHAADTLRTLPPAEQQLSIVISAKSGILLIKTTNRCDSPNSGGNFFIGNMPLLSEREAQADTGLQHMAAIAKKYGGFVQFHRKDGSFAVQVFLCMFWPRIA